MKALWIAISMYSKLPAPHVEWDKRGLSWALCWLPVVGLVIGALLWGWFWLCGALGFGALLRGAGALVIPVALSGGIHLDGFCDTADALGSHQEREKKLEILKDTHTGAFAVICCGLYLLVFFAAWCEVEPAGDAGWVLCLTPVLSRCLSALAAVSWKNARGTGLLCTFTEPVDGKKARVLLGLLSLLTVVALVWLDLWTGLGAVLGAGLSFLYYRVMSWRQFGGITGDLAGFFLQVCECAMVLGVVIAQRLEVLL